ncbi:MAG: hypothetical protein QW074_07795 [Candidatus Caldarchaeum sp.]
MSEYSGLGGEYVEIPFEVLKEEWNTYLMEDGSVIRARAVLLRIRLQPDSRQGRFQTTLDVQNILMVSAPTNLRGKATEPPTMDEVLYPARYGVAVRVLQGEERYNVYRVMPKGPVFKTKMVASDMAFRLTGRYDSDGQPVYVLQTSLAVMSPPGSRIEFST